MAEKVYEPETIQDTPIPGHEEQSYSVDQSSGGVVEASKIRENGFPSRRVAVDLLSSALNTKSKKVLQSFDLVEQGAFRVGKYENGVSGEVAITPAGITARNTSGVTTFSLLGEDGSAVFAGDIQAGAFFSGLVVVGDNRFVIDGENGRMTVSDGNNNIIAIGNLDF